MPSSDGCWFRKRQHEASIAEFERAIALNPNFTDWRFAAALVYAGEPARAIEVVEAHMRLDPFYPPLAARLVGVRPLYAQSSMRKRCRRYANVSRERRTSEAGHVWLAATYAQLGQLEEARAEAAEVLRIDPKYTIDGTTRPTERLQATRGRRALLRRPAQGGAAGMTERQQRRLAAILAADIAGYSALMGADEEATVRDLKAHQAVVLPMIGEHGGRIIDTAGDGVLAEFASVLNAVKCAVAVQKTMAERNADVDAARRMQFRVGVNQGDVVFDDARVYGDGVNVAARLEAIAEPGGICISAKVHDEIRGKIDIELKDMGPQQLKNIAEPVRVYQIEVCRTGAAPHHSTRKAPLALPDKPSIAVLPFTNLSGDPEQDYFSDGITEDIITELSRFSELFVIARNSSFQYKGKSPDVRQVGRELGVRYVLEGSIRRVGDRVRITAQLIDAMTGAPPLGRTLRP